MFLLLNSRTMVPTSSVMPVWPCALASSCSWTALIQILWVCVLSGCADVMCRIVLWFGGGVPGKQYGLIRKDGIPIEKYLARTMDGKLLQYLVVAQSLSMLQQALGCVMQL